MYSSQIMSQSNKVCVHTLKAVARMRMRMRMNAIMIMMMMVLLLLLLSIVNLPSLTIRIMAAAAQEEEEKESLSSSISSLPLSSSSSSGGSSSSSGDDGSGRIPMIDLGSASSSPQEEQIVVEQIREACHMVGFFIITTNTTSDLVNASIVNDAWQAMTAFFTLTVDEKLPYASSNVTAYPYGYENATEQLTQGKALDYDNHLEDATITATDTLPIYEAKETFSMGPHNLASGMPLRQWVASAPLANNNFQSALETYYAAMEGFALQIFQYLALALHLPADYFESKMNHHMSALRLLHYYPLLDQRNNDDDDDDIVFHNTATAACNSNSSNNNQNNNNNNSNRNVVICAGAHTDYGAFTILFAPQPGLQVRLLDKKTNQSMWYCVPAVPEGSFVVNLGDLMQFWTNDEWVSTLHRVVLPLGGPSRYSMAYFVNVNGDTRMEPLTRATNTGCSSSENPPIIMTAREHLMAKHLASVMGGTDRAVSYLKGDDEDDEL